MSPSAAAAFATSPEGDSAEAGTQAVRRIRAGDPTALEALYAEHSRRVYAVLLRILRDPADAQDLLQEVFLNVWMRAHSYDEARGPVRAWVMSMARSRAVDRLRQHGSKSVLEAGSDGPSPPPGVFEQVALLEGQQRLSAAMALLPSEQREVIALAYFDGLSLSEVSAATTTPLGTVKTRVRLALGKLAAGLGEP